MPNPKQYHVVANMQQDFTEAEKAQARLNIGAAAAGSMASIDRTDVRGDTFDVDELHFRQKGVSTANIVAGSTDLGSTVPLPTLASEEGKVPVAYFRDGRGYYLLERIIPAHTQNDAAKVLSVDSTNALKWVALSLPSYTAGEGIDITGSQISWDYSVGRNLHLNQNKAIQTNLPGGLFDAPATASSSFNPISGANFAGAFRLACRLNTNGTYELAISYTASGTSSTVTFIGTETVIGTDDSITVNQAAYIADQVYYTPSRRFGDTASTPFDPTIHKAIIYNGIAQIGPTSDCKIAIWNDNGNVKISMTAIEVGKVGATN